MAKVILYVATSADGFIADKNGGVDWLPNPKEEDKNDEVGFKALLNSIQSIFMGRRSYEQIISFGPWAWPEKSTYVFTSKKLTTNQQNIFFVHEEPKSFMNKFRKEKPNQNVWLLGGAELSKSFFNLGLIDECIITIIPVSLNEGIFLPIPLDDFSLAQIKECQDNLLQKTYVKKPRSSYTNAHTQNKM